MQGNRTYYLMSVTEWRVVHEGDFDSCIEYVETAIAAGSKDTFIRTFEQIPIVSDCVQIRKDRFIAEQRKKSPSVIEQTNS
jgi:hypothetical protein